MSVTPDFVGQIYKDTTNGNLWRANSLTPGDWTLELQNGLMKWTPRTIKMPEVLGYNYSTNLLEATELVFEQSTVTQPIQIYETTISSVRFPNLLTVDPDYWWGSDLDFSGATALNNLELPLVNNFGSGSLKAIGCTSLPSISLPSLVTIAEVIDFQSCSSLVSVSFPLFLPTNSKAVNFANCALSSASVNHILARCVANAGYVSGVVNVQGGTSAAPTGQGVADKATLIGRGVTVNTN